MKTIEWVGIDDGWGIVGYGFYCPNCEKFNMFCGTDDPIVECEYCKKEFHNPGDPDD